MRLFADDTYLSYQHSDPEYLNEVINKKIVKGDKWLLLINFLLTIQKLKFCFSIELQKTMNLVLRSVDFVLSLVIV